MNEMNVTVGELAKGYTYRLTVSGVELVAKITKRSGHVYRGKISRDYGFSFLTFHIGQVTRAERLDS